MFRYFNYALLIFALTSLPVALLAEQKPPESSLENLEQVEDFDRGKFYSDPDVDWSAYTGVQLEAATVAFRRNWQRDQNKVDPFRVRDEDVERIKQDMATLFDEVFTDELTSNGGYTISSDAGDGVMRIEPHIVDLDVHAPYTRRTSFNRSYTERAGRMTLKLYIFDSLSGDLIAAVNASQEAMSRPTAQLSNKVTNQAEATRMLQKWARILREKLDEARNR
jgi:hypothetical protein